MKTIDQMNRLQNQFYNALTKALALNKQYFQLFSSGPIVKSDNDLWSLQDQIPPFSLTWNPLTYKAPPFFSQYADLVNELSFPKSKFENDIGTSNYEDWQRYLGNLKPQPAVNIIPSVFQRWAMINCPSKMAIGLSDLNSMTLMSCGQQQLKPYEGQNPLHVNFTNTLNDVKKSLNASSSKTIIMDSKSTDSNVDDTWTKGVDSCDFGLWADSSKSSLLNEKFSNSHVNVSIKFQKSTTLSFSPGVWYNSGLLHMAYVANQEQIPWPSNPNPSWNSLFGNKGTMNYLTLASTIVDGISFKLTSEANFTKDEQYRIIENLENGIWPIYDSEIIYTASFDKYGMTINGSKSIGNPTFIGAHVCSIENSLISA